MGGNSKLAMSDLRSLLSSLGYGEVSTYLNSGNASFTSPRDGTEALEREIEESIAQELGLAIPVAIRTPQEMAAVVAANPFPEAAAEPKSLHVSFLSAQPSPETGERLGSRRFEPNRFHIGDRAMYLWYPDGVIAASKASQFWGRVLGEAGVIGTARNWNTVTKLASLPEE